MTLKESCCLFPSVCDPTAIEEEKKKQVAGERLSSITAPVNASISAGRDQSLNSPSRFIRSAPPHSVYHVTSHIITCRHSIHAYCTLLVQSLDNLRFQVGRVDTVVARHGAVLGNQKFSSEVPHDVATAARLILEEGVDRVLLPSVHIDLGHHGELCAFLLCKFFDVHFAALFLVPKLIAREGQNLKALFGILIVQLDHCLVFRIRHASCTRDVGNHDNPIVPL